MLVAHGDSGAEKGPVCAEMLQEHVDDEQPDVLHQVDLVYITILPHRAKSDAGAVRWRRSKCGGVK
jgi:hypothetical protein